MPLPKPWIDRLFTKLTLNYGQSFLRQYDGIPIDHPAPGHRDYDPENDTAVPTVMQNWAQELDGFKGEDIGYALRNLPLSRAPNVLEFKELCRKAPATPQTQQLDYKAPADPQVIAKAQHAIKSNRFAGNREWAEKLKAREERGLGLSKYQRDAWRAALAKK